MRQRAVQAKIEGIVLSGPLGDLEAQSEDIWEMESQTATDNAGVPKRKSFDALSLSFLDRERRSATTQQSKKMCLKVYGT